MKSVIAAVLLALPAVAWAEPDPSLHAKYSAYSNGLNVLDMQASLALTPRNYSLEINYRTTGFVGALIHVRGDTRVEGSFGVNRPVPRSLFSTGYIRGAPHVTQMEWKSGHPSIVQLTPPIAEDGRDPVAEADQAGTVDSLSAIAQLMHDVGATGRCDGALNTFDGRRLADLSTRTVGTENLPPTGRSSFHGPALRCDFTGHQLGGFVHDVDRAELQKPQRGTAWFASVHPGEPPIPVRFVFETRSFGPATAYLTE
jgi:hypothetical protein